MIVDSHQTLRILVPGPESANLLAPLPVAQGGFAAHHWALSGAPHPALAVPAAGGGGLSAGYWSEIFVCGRTSVSQYDALRNGVSGGCLLPGPVACLTLGGTGLHGQHGRPWKALDGNLHLSVAFPCDLDLEMCGPPLPMLAAVALCEAVEVLTAGASAPTPPPGIKWVNDVVLDGAKLGGVLTAVRSARGRITEVFAGLGLNLAVVPALPESVFGLPPTSLSAIMEPPHLGHAFGVVLNCLQARFIELCEQGPGPLVTAYCDRSLVIGREVGIWDDATSGSAMADLPPPRLRGVVTAIRSDLGLTFEGHADPVRTGRLRLLGNEK